MATIVETLMESEAGQKYLSDNAELFESAEDVMQDFKKVMKAFVLNNTTEFLGENLEETIKNIRVFSEVATSQFMMEIADITSKLASEQKEINETSLSSYI